MSESEESEKEKIEDDSDIELDFESVFGPFLYADPLGEETASMLVNQVIHFFIPISHFSFLSSSSRNCNLAGTNVYPYNSSLPLIAVHQGVIFLDKQNGDQNNFNGARRVNIYKKDWELAREERRKLKITGNQTIKGVDLIIRVTEKLSKFEGTRQYEFKTRTSAKSPFYGLAVIFGQATSVEPEAYDISQIVHIPALLNCEINDHHWMRFGLTGEAMDSYKLVDFIDEGRPSDKWLCYQLRKSCLYLDTLSERFELSSLNGILFRLCKMKKPYICIAQMRSDGTPVKEFKRTMIRDSVNWEDIIWNEEGVTVLDFEVKPVLSFFWARRRRSIQVPLPNPS